MAEQTTGFLLSAGRGMFGALRSIAMSPIDTRAELVRLAATMTLAGTLIGAAIGVVLTALVVLVS
jgi:hypothetical protein